MRLADKNTIRLIDLFAGAGGMTCGFVTAMGKRIEIVWANDFNDSAVETYKANFGNHCIAGDIVSILESPKTVIPAADIVIGGPPCQGFSLLNKNRVHDSRKQLWRPFLEVVERSGATVFIMENVTQLLGSLEFQDIISASHRLGFKVKSWKLCAADYGVPQVRWRAFIIGCKFIDPDFAFPPQKKHYNPNSNATNTEGLLCWRTVRDAIGDLPKPIGTDIGNIAPPLNLHFRRTPTPKSLRRYRLIPKEGMNRFDLQRVAPELTPQCWIDKTSGGTDLFGRLWWDRPAFTIRTEFYKPEKGRYLHPVQHRPITYREAARFQTFPDDFVFKGTKNEIAKQIGNAVPVDLAKAIAESAAELFSFREVGKSLRISSKSAGPASTNVRNNDTEYAEREGRMPGFRKGKVSG